MIDLCLIALPNKALTNPTMYFPLGILYLASAVKNAGFAVKITDMRAGLTKVPRAKFYGFSCTTPEIPLAKMLSKTLEGKTIIGGPHATLVPDDCVGFDYVVTGEGEEVLPSLVKGSPSKKCFPAPRIRNLDKIAYPAWDLVEHPFSKELFPGERYGKGQLAMTIIGSRGCPHNCAFCGNMFNAPVTFRSVGNIIGELEQLMKRGVRYFRFEDDNITLHPHFYDLCFGLKLLKIKWKCHTRSQFLTLEMAQIMKKSGCEECGLGVESADDDVLYLNRKKEFVEDHIKAVLTLKKAGLRAKTYMIAGLPGETDKTLEINKRFFETTKPDKWTLSTFTPYPGCDIYNHPDKYGIRILDWDYTHWWNFVEDGFVHELSTEPREVTWNRYKEFYTWLVEEGWK